MQTVGVFPEMVKPLIADDKGMVTLTAAVARALFDLQDCRALFAQKQPAMDDAMFLRHLSGGFLAVKLFQLLQRPQGASSSRASSSNVVVQPAVQISTTPAGLGRKPMFGGEKRKASTPSSVIDLVATARQKTQEDDLFSAASMARQVPDPNMGAAPAIFPQSASAVGLSGDLGAPGLLSGPHLGTSLGSLEPKVGMLISHLAGSGIEKSFIRGCAGNYAGLPGILLNSCLVFIRESLHIIMPEVPFTLKHVMSLICGRIADVPLGTVICKDRLLGASNASAWPTTAKPWFYFNKDTGAENWNKYVDCPTVLLDAVGGLMQLVRYVRGDQHRSELIAECDCKHVLTTIRVWAREHSIEAVLFAVYCLFRSSSDSAQQAATLQGGFGSPFRKMDHQHLEVIRQHRMLLDIRAAESAATAATQVAQTMLAGFGGGGAVRQVPVKQGQFPTTTALPNPGFDVASKGYKPISESAERAFAQKFKIQGQSPCIFKLLFNKCSHQDGHLVDGVARSHAKNLFKIDKPVHTTWVEVKGSWFHK
jgi:hypothetical protein